MLEAGGFYSKIPNEKTGCHQLVRRQDKLTSSDMSSPFARYDISASDYQSSKYLPRIASRLTMEPLQVLNRFWLEIIAIR